MSFRIAFRIASFRYAKTYLKMAKTLSPDWVFSSNILFVMYISSLFFLCQIRHSYDLIRAIKIKVQGSKKHQKMTSFSETQKNLFFFFFCLSFLFFSFFLPMVNVHKRWEGRSEVIKGRSFESMAANIWAHTDCSRRKKGRREGGTRYDDKLEHMYSCWYATIDG